MKIALGLDIAKSKFDAAILLNGRIKNKTFPNNREGYSKLTEWIKTLENIHACMESTGCYGVALAKYLYDNNIPISVVNPFKIKAYGNSKLVRNKTDKVDARIIASFCAQNDDLRGWTPKTEEVEKLHALSKRLDELMDMRQQEKNRMEFANPEIKCYLAETIEIFNQQIKTVKGEIKNLIEHNADLKKKKELLSTIPGIGEATITKILAIIDKPEAFSNAKQVAAFIGVTPRNCSSGSSVLGKTRLSKIGNAELRKALYFPAVTAIRYNPIVKRFAERLAQKGKNKMCIIGAVMRKLVHIIYGVLKSGNQFDVSLA